MIPCGSTFHENSARLKHLFLAPLAREDQGFFTQSLIKEDHFCVHHKDMFESRRHSKLCRQDYAWTATVHRSSQAHTLAASDYSLVKEQFYPDTKPFRVRLPFPFASLSCPRWGG